MKIGNFFSSLFQKVKDHKSDLMMSVGTAGVLGGTVLLCKETLNAPKILNEYREAKEDLEEDGAEKNDILKLRLKMVGKMTLNFLPGAVVEGAGLGSMWGGYSNMKAAFISVGAAYSGLQEFINQYREGVKERYGEEVDEELAYKFRTEEVVIEDENGETKTETVRIYPHDHRKMPSIYARYFCYGEADAAEKDDDYNGRFLRLQQDAANRSFRAHKKMMLNELYETFLGIKPSIAGNHVGWVYDKTAPEGDNYIDFRIQRVFREKEDGDGWEKVWMIDPNVDGLVEKHMLELGLVDE